MDDFMRRAVKLAAENVREGGQPFGAVLVKEDEIVTEGVNELHKKYDVSGHAEMLAIRGAQEKLQTNDLSGFVMYASGEPCPMCLAAIYYGGVDHIYYCASVEEAVAAGLEKAEVIYKDLQKPREERSVPMRHMRLEEGQENPMALWEERNS